MAFDIQNGNTVLHGGVETINLHVGDGNDTWMWNGSVSTQVSDISPDIHHAASEVLRISSALDVSVVQ